MRILLKIIQINLFGLNWMKKQHPLYVTHLGQLETQKEFYILIALQFSMHMG